MANFSSADLKKIDSLDMFSILKNFPDQVYEAIEIGKSAPIFKEAPVSGDFLVLGMGGSAIGGDLLKSFCEATPGADHVVIRTNRGYNIPASVNENTNIIASSYSGNTEETISALEQASKLTSRIVCITTGGKLEEFAKANGIPVIKIPGGLQPRCALGYSFFPMIMLLMKSGVFKKPESELVDFNELLGVLRKKSAIYSDFEDVENYAMKIAGQLFDTVPVIYSSSERMDSVNLRWRCQIQENAKQLAFGNLLPEMNHNEINSWSYPEGLSERFSVLFLRDLMDHPRVQTRFDALQTLIESSVKQIITFKGEGNNLLSRMFDLIYLGDWISYYMAIFNNADPTPIPLISRLKNELLRD